MARSNIKAVFENDVQTVWNVITDVKNYIWRTDLSKTEIISDKQFIEYTKNGYATTFTITLFEPYKRWEFDVENSNIKGHWIGIFTQKGENAIGGLHQTVLRSKTDAMRSERTKLIQL